MCFEDGSRGSSSVRNFTNISANITANIVMALIWNFLQAVQTTRCTLAVWSPIEMLPWQTTRFCCLLRREISPSRTMSHKHIRAAIWQWWATLRLLLGRDLKPLAFGVKCDLKFVYTKAFSRCEIWQVTIENDSPIAKIDYWNLSWTWQENEFITKMQGATTKSADLDVCLNGIAGKIYTNPDLNKVFSCSVSPEIIDLPLQSYNDTQIGGIQYCCRNGTIWPAVLDPSKSKSAFLMNVMKVPPQSNQLNHITPPGNWRFGDGRFKCGLPRRIKSTVYPDPYLLHETTAFKTWQVLSKYS